MNLNLVIDTSRFKPFEYYNAALQTMKDYGTLYEKQQAVYDKIALTLGDLASAVEGSTKAKQIYDVYLNLFNATASDFANGMNIRNAKELSELRKLYGTLIRLLERANEARVKEAERRRAAKPEQNMLYELMGTLDDYLTDPNRIYGSYSGTLLTNEVSALAAAAGKDIINRYNEGSLDPYTKIWVEKKGLSSENVNKAVQEVQLGGIDNVSDPIMKNILKNAMQASGIYNWADESTKRTAEQLAARGLYGGIGQATSGTYEDYGAKKATDHYYHELEADAAQQRSLDLLRAKSDQDFSNSLGGTYGRSYLEEIEGNGNTRYLNLLNSMQSLVDADGKLKQEYRAARGKVGDPMKIYKDYLNYIKQHNGTLINGAPWIPSTFGVSYPISNSSNNDALQYIKNKYGVSSVISTDQYNALKSLGYDTGSTFATTYGGTTNYDISDYNERLNNLASRKTTSYASGTKIREALNDRIHLGLKHYKSNNALKEIDGLLLNIGTADWNAVKEKKIDEVGIDIGAKKVVFVTEDGDKYAVDPNIISADFLKAFNAHINGTIPGIPSVLSIENNSRLTEAQKAKDLYSLLETILVELMKHVGRDIFQVKGETSNNE